jgi:hypothetical protein
MVPISAIKRRNAWRRAIRQVGVLFVAIGLGNFAFTIFRGKFEFLQALFLAIFLNVAGILAINYSIETEEEETHDLAREESQRKQSSNCAREPSSNEEPAASDAISGVPPS